MLASFLLRRAWDDPISLRADELVPASVSLQPLGSRRTYVGESAVTNGRQNLQRPSFQLRKASPLRCWPTLIHVSVGGARCTQHVGMLTSMHRHGRSGGEAAITPFQEGVVAAKSATNATSNPYLPGTDTHAAWGKGYMAAEAAFQGEDDREVSGPMLAGPPGWRSAQQPLAVTAARSERLWTAFTDELDDSLVRVDGFQQDEAEGE